MEMTSYAVLFCDPNSDVRKEDGPVCRKSGLLTTILLFYCWSCCIDTILSTARPQIPPHIHSSSHDARACRGIMHLNLNMYGGQSLSPFICLIAKSLFCADSCSLNAHPKSATWDMGSLLDCQPVFPLVCTYSCPYLLFGPYIVDGHIELYIQRARATQMLEKTMALCY